MLLLGELLGCEVPMRSRMFVDLVDPSDPGAPLEVGALDKPDDLSRMPAFIGTVVRADASLLWAPFLLLPRKRLPPNALTLSYFESPMLAEVEEALFGALLASLMTSSLGAGLATHLGLTRLTCNGFFFSTS